MYPSSLAHILAELERIDLLIQTRAWAVRQSDAIEMQQDQLLNWLSQPHGIPHWATASTSIVQQEAQLMASIEGQVKESIAAGIPLRLVILSQLFRLSPFEVDVLLIALAPEIEPRYGTIFAAMQPETRQSRPTVNLVLNLLCPTYELKIQARSCFSTECNLLYFRLIELDSPPLTENGPLLSQTIRIDRRIADFLLDNEALDTRLEGIVEFRLPTADLASLIQPAEFKDNLSQLVFSDRRTVLYFQGDYGVGKQSTAEALCKQLGVALLVINGEAVCSKNTNNNIMDFVGILRLILREALLFGAAIYWHGFDALLELEHTGHLASFWQEIEKYSGLVFLAGQTLWTPVDIPDSLHFIHLRFARPTYDERVALWKQLAGHTYQNIDWRDLANKFRFTAGQIRDVIQTIKGLLLAHNAPPTLDDFFAACRMQSNRGLSSLARKITPSHGWDDLILPDEQKSVLLEIYNQMRYRAQVFYEWGFDRKFSLGKGLSALFAGPSGTGKTLAAEIIAGELGLELYKIDLSSMISKYIGETEKNLAQIFAEAETSNAILFFDEADALFGKRSDVSDSHDRYANIQVSYLLQRMEEYDGVVILTTNLRKNMDEAFVRRMGFILEFPFPNGDQRRQIWEKVWPSEIPLSTDVDLALMAQRYDLTGGNIRNIALASAFLAASEGTSVNMVHLMKATRREYQKLGKIVSDKDFLKST